MPHELNRRLGGGGEPGKATIYDVAKLAGVSVSTVSHVINRTRRVEAPTRERVRAAISDLGYERNALANALASGLRGRRARVLGLVLPNLHNPITVTIARGVETVAGAAGYGLFLCNSEEQPERQRANIRTLLEHQVSGILVNPVRGTAPDLERLQERGMPLVSLGYQAAGLPRDSVRLDYAMGGRLAVEHLVARGHRRIAALLCHADPTHPVVTERRRGYAAALLAAGIEPDPALEFLSENLVDDARRVVGAALKTGHAPFTAAIAFMPLATLGLLAALRENGLDVPRDVSVIGFGDEEWMAVYPPPITAVDQPNYEVGRLGAELLMSRIEEAQHASVDSQLDSSSPCNGHPSEPKVVHVATRLIERDSVA